jgi:excisionase family DNA binding protein
VETKTQEAVVCGEFITCREAAELLRMSEASIRRYLTIGKLKRYKVGAHTLVKFAEARGLICEPAA